MLVAAAMSGCRNNDPSNAVDITQRTEMGVYNATAELMVYNDADYQYSITSNRRRCRIQKDDLSCYVSVEFASAPKVGNVSATISWGGLELPPAMKNCQLEIRKVGNEKLWAWNAENNIGIVLPWR